MKSRSRPVFIDVLVWLVKSEPLRVSKMIVIRQEFGVNIGIVVSGVDISDIDFAIIHVVARMPVLRS